MVSKLEQMHEEYAEDCGTQHAHPSIWSSIRWHAMDKVWIVCQAYVRVTRQVFKESGISIRLDFKGSDRA